ncbi:MAG: metallophosphoesterase [Lachnospiraceae bacterium]|nr:metallophosphoesterase [Lachnospiraceae bacterium]
MKLFSTTLYQISFLFLLLLGLTGCSSLQETGKKPSGQRQESSKQTPAENSQQSSEGILPADIDAYTIQIPGITQDYQLLFLTDTHITLPCPASEEGSSAQIESYTQERLTQFMAESGRDSSEIFTAWIDYAQIEQLNGILFGGDIIDSPSPSNLKFLNQHLESLQLPYCYTLGNHDWTYPWAYMTEEANTQYLPQLSPYMEDNPVIHSQDFGEFVVVAIDNSSNQIHPAALEEYKNILSQGKPVIVLLHVPLYTESVLEKAMAVWSGGVILGGGIHGGIYPNETSTEFLYLTTAKDSPVAAVLAGHIHLSDASHIQGEKEVLQITGDAGYKGKGSILRITPQ